MSRYTTAISYQPKKQSPTEIMPCIEPKGETFLAVPQAFLSGFLYIDSIIINEPCYPTHKLTKLPMISI